VAAISKENPASTEWRKIMMSRLATLVIVAMLGVYITQVPPAATIQRAGDWSAKASSAGMVKTSGHAAAARTPEDAEYQAQLCECDALDGTARHHCIEYVKLRAGRS